MRLVHKGLILVSVPLIFELVLLCTLAWLLVQAEQESRKAERAQSMVWEINALLQEMVAAGSTMFAYSLHKSPFLAERYEALRQQIPEELRTLSQLVGNRPDATPRLERINIGTARLLQLMDQAKNVLDQGERMSIGILQLRPEIERVSEGVYVDLEALLDQEREIMQKTSPAAAASFRELVKAALVAAVIVSIILAFALAIFFNRGTARRLAVLMENTVRLAQRKPLTPLTRGSDELAHLDKVFHEMADALAQSIKREQSLIENAQDVICSLDRSGSFVAVNPATSKVLGYKPEELIGRPAKSLVTPEGAQSFEEQLLEPLEAGQPRRVEISVLRKDGSKIDTSWSVHWSEADQLLFSVVHDITQQKEIERLKQQFTDMITHDVRIPLTSIRLTIQLLENGICGNLPEAARTRIASMEKSTQLIMDLINDLLTVEKLEAGKMQLERTLQPIVPILEKAVETVQETACAKHVRLELACVPCELEADGPRIGQVIMNLLSNAIKFSPQGSVIKVTAHELPEEIEVRVTDQGRGIPVAYQQKIFDRFQQLYVSDATQKGGSGLGLAVCKAIVEAHGGTIGIDSQDNCGTTVWFRLPKAAAADEKISAARA